MFCVASTLVKNVANASSLIGLSLIIKVKHLLVFFTLRIHPFRDLRVVTISDSLKSYLIYYD